MKDFSVTIPVSITVSARDRTQAQAMAGGFLIGSLRVGAERGGFDWAIVGDPVTAPVANTTGGNE